LGIVGIIMTLVVVRRYARPDPPTVRAVSPLERRALVVQKPEAVGITLSELRQRAGGRVLISRVARGPDYVVTSPALTLLADDVILAVGAPADLDALEGLCGSRSPRDLLTEPSELKIRNMLVSEKMAALRTLSALDPGATQAVTVTRIERAGVELLATEGIPLQLGDRLRVVGPSEALERFARVVGNSAPALDHANLVPFLLGILLGVVLGSIPLAIPGLPAALKLGLAGGPLLVALLVAARGRLGQADVYLPSAAIFFMKEFGIVLFLSCVGLLSGEAFMRTISRPDGFVLIGIGVLITTLPLMIVAALALFWKYPYGLIAGLIAGGMTDPPALAFAQASATSESPSRIYATVYPLTMLARIACAQILILLLS
jgi:putative transport protein